MTTPSQGRTGREVVRSYPTYDDARGAIDHLSTTHFPVEESAIVAEGPQMVECVTGRVGYRQAALSAFANGAWAGAVVGLVLGLFTVRPLLTGLVLAMWGLLVGGLVCIVLRIAGQALRRDGRDVESVQGSRPGGTTSSSLLGSRHAHASSSTAVAVWEPPAGGRGRCRPVGSSCERDVAGVTGKPV